MKKKLIWLVATIFLASPVLTSCSTNDNPAVGPDVPQSKNYTERMVPVVDPSGDAQGVVQLRFYNDMPSVAYVSISNFQSMIYPGTTVQVVKTATDQYQLTSPCGTATVNTTNDVFESDDYEAFTNMMGMLQPGMPNILYDALPIIRWKSLEATPTNVHVALDYGKYGIDLRADDDQVYFPFATIADLYADGYMHIAAFNGECVMVTPDGSYSIGKYPAPFITPILQPTRTADMVDFSYRNLCFTLTHFFGYPGRTLLEESMKQKGLDQALQDYGTAGQLTCQLLRSSDMYEYILGTKTLSCLLDDGGHTYTDVTKISDLSGNPDFVSILTTVTDAKMAEFNNVCPEYAPVKKVIDDRRALGKQMRQMREEKFGKGVKYYKDGATAYCQFESFECDDSGWRKFYRGEAAKPTIAEYPDDWLVALVDALQKAEADPEVKNFVLDISTNGGGSSDVVMFITSLFCNKADLHYENALTGQRMKASFDVDRNLDGKFDEKDAQVKYNLNFAVLISAYSFSCANLLPALLKDYGIPLIGQQSGGGSCCVIYGPSAEGFGYRSSSHRTRLVNLKGENIDPGITPTYQLDNLDDYFNIPKLTQLIETYYTK